jgi:hypothetical protein
MYFGVQFRETLGVKFVVDVKLRSISGESFGYSLGRCLWRDGLNGRRSFKSAFDNLSEEH